LGANFYKVVLNGELSREQLKKWALNILLCHWQVLGH